MKHLRIITLLIFLSIASMSLFSQFSPSDPTSEGGGSSVPLDGGLLLGLLAGGSALSAYFFKKKKKED